MSFFIQYLHLNFHSFLGFQRGSGSSVKAIMRLSATLPLAIGLKCFWFLIALLLYPKSTILGLSFLDPKDLCLPNQFSKAFCQYILNLMSKKKLGSFNDWINAYFQSFICLPPHAMNIFWPASLLKFPWRFWTELVLIIIKKIYEKLAKQLNFIPQHNPLVSSNQNPTTMITRK